MKLIDKDALVAEIEELNTALNEKIKSGVESSYWRGLSLVCERLKFRINTLEVKEVDLEKEISFQWSKFCLNDKDKDSFVKVAKHFFELGLKAQNITTNLEQRISVLKMEFWTGLQTFENSEMTLSDAYSQGINDILEELDIKAQKGE